MQAPVIDPRITPRDMLTLLKAEIDNIGIAGHHIESMNSFYRVGIKQIITKIFLIEGRLKNKRQRDEEDRDITDIEFSVNFTDVNITPPMTQKYRSGVPEMLTPNMARLMNLSYSCDIHVNATIRATATMKNGDTKTRTANITNHRIGAVPCMLGTELCHTYRCDRETLKEWQEDPSSPGGYFILNGGEWAVDSLENVPHNAFYVFKNLHLNEISRGTFLSKPGDAFENSYMIIIRHLNDGAITVELTTNKFNGVEIPFYMIFRALGMTSDREICDHICYGVDNGDTITKFILDALSTAFDVVDPKFPAGKDARVPADVISMLAMKLNAGVGTSVNVRRDENIAKHLNTGVLNILDKYFLLHVGQRPEDRIRKLRFLGHLINRLLRVERGAAEPTDRDNYKNKRIHPAGICLAKAFKTNFNFANVQEIKRYLMRVFASASFSSVHLAEAVTSAINADDLERMLTQAITTGNKTITLKRNEVTNRISSQSVYHKNDANIISVLNNINAANSGSVSKQNERADEMRRVHPSYLGNVDPSQSPEAGDNVGMNKQKTLAARITGASSSYALKAQLMEDPDLIPLDLVAPSDITAKRLAKVLVNGDWIGCTHSAHNFAAKYRQMRREEQIDYLTTIVWEPLVHEMSFWVDAGRIVQMLVIVYNNLSEYIASRRESNGGGEPVPFRQWIKLTHDHITGIRAGRISMDDLRREGVIEYIAPEEAESAYIAPDLDTLREYQFDVTHRYTHMTIPQSIFGLVMLGAPHANHSSSVRNAIYTSHRKQAAGWPMLNWPFRVDKNVFLQYYGERPLVGTFADVFTRPSGHNCIVALMIHGGQNQEDSVKANQSSIDCGLFNGCYFNFEKTELDKGEVFGNPDRLRTLDLKKDANYEFVENGFIRKGTIARRGYVLIVKTARIQKPVDNFAYTDKSVVYRRDEPAYVERVVSAYSSDNKPFAKVKLRSVRPLIVGDKLSSKTGNKGIVAQKVPRVDMPYTESGLVPDLIINPHSIPTRMALSQIIECGRGLIAARKGCIADATCFLPVDIGGIFEEIERAGVKYAGHQRMYSGMHGKAISVHIFIGPTSYQRLQKFIIDESYAMRTGPTLPLTRQPTDGKKREGGLRMGEMERDVQCAQGTMRTLFEKFYDDSDGIEIPFCRGCGNRAVVNTRAGIYKCKECGDDADIAMVASSFVANLFFNEASAMNIKLNFELAPHEFVAAEGAE